MSLCEHYRMNLHNTNLDGIAYYTLRLYGISCRICSLLLPKCYLVHDYAKDVGQPSALGRGAGLWGCQGRSHGTYFKCVYSCFL